MATPFAGARCKPLLALAALVACAAAGAAPSPHAGPGAWVLAYEGQSTNRFISDRRAVALVRSSVPAALSRDVLDALGGPPGPVLVQAGRYLAATACVRHYCPDKGWFWIDSRTGIGLGAYYASPDGVLRIGSTSIAPARVPPPARRALLAWLADYGLTPSAVSFVSRDGRAIRLAPGPFTPPRAYQPPPGGPSFDCRKAATLAEQRICASAALSAQDLALARLVREVRHGHATAAARAELVSLQRRWLGQRDVRCRARAGMDACLGAQYRAQIERIGNWVPSAASRQGSPSLR